MEFQLADHRSRRPILLLSISGPSAACILVGAMLERFAGWPATLVQPDGRGIAAFAAMVSIALLTSWLFACCTEDYTAEVRRRLARLVLK